MKFPQDVQRAEGRIRPWVRRTPVQLARDTGPGRMYLKLENHQETGSFKLRGALSFVTALNARERARGVVAASSGNHGLGVAHSLAALGIQGTIVLPENAAPNKVARIGEYGVNVHAHGGDCVDAEAFARAFADEREMQYVSPYNDERVIAGQGTLGLELDWQLDRIDSIYIAMGGGGLISGVAGTLKSLGRDVRVVGCSPRNSPVLHESLRAGRVLDIASSPTLSDGTAGGMEPDSITLELAAGSVDECVLVDEDEIAREMRWLFEHHGMLVEGAAAVALAGWRKDSARARDEVAVVVLCGGNVSSGALRALHGRAT